jgi:gamma-glutamylcyclotransferase (GGCT)/AIG2-like uncharacterized protein YtfP
MTFVFVYGTLKRGDCRHRFLAGSHFCGPALTRPGYRLYQLGEFPGLVASESGGCIEGELYRVSDAVLALLDDVEAVADSLFERAAVRLQAPHSDLAVQAYFYRGSVEGCRELVRRWAVPS